MTITVTVGSTLLAGDHVYGLADLHEADSAYAFILSGGNVEPDDPDDEDLDVETLAQISAAREEIRRTGGRSDRDVRGGA